ncbi:MAG: LuxR C-terminal-related transcriptional regulator [Planctomycetota bacterium]
MAIHALRTLVVEDDPDHADLLRLELGRIKELTFDVAHCSTCDEAMDRLSDNEAFDLVFVDYWLEGQTSEVILDRLRDAGQGVPVVVTTGANDEYIAATVTRAGAHRYLRKDDLSVPLLREAIRDAMHDAQAGSEEAAEARDARERLARLTPRELQIAKLIGEGLLSKQIAQQIGCTEGTVNLHRSHIMQKTKARSVADVVRLVLRSA